jgi:hypothetical protein
MALDGIRFRDVYLKVCGRRGLGRQRVRQRRLGAGRPRRQPGCCLKPHSSLLLTWQTGASANSPPPPNSALF